MSKLNSIFNSIPVKIGPRSGFDLSNEHLFSGTTGTLIPVQMIECLPGDRISMGTSFKVTLPPLAVPFMGRVDIAFDAFFVPNRLVWKGWESFITQNNGVSPSRPGSGSLQSPPPSVPLVSMPLGNNADVPEAPFWGPGTLSDYLGAKRPAPSGVGSPAQTRKISALPFLRYHKICDDWYRDENTTLPFFSKNPYIGDSSSVVQEQGLSARVINSYQVGSSVPVLPLVPPSGSSLSSFLAVDTTIGLGSLRQRCWAKDYFTSATYQPQAGAASSVLFDTSGNTGQFTIASLRAANSLQKWMERNNIAGVDYGDQIMAHFGVRPPSAIMNKAILLGSCREPVYVGSVENNNGASEQTGNSSSPFGNVFGSSAGTGGSAGKGSLFSNFDVKEHGAIYVIASLVPHAYYSTGQNKYFDCTTVDSFPWPELANIGDEPIYSHELNGNVMPALDVVFGYQQRYAAWKHRPDEVSGLLNAWASSPFSSSDSGSLEVFALQRAFESPVSDYVPTLSKSFVEIPTSFLNQVLATELQQSGFSFIADAYFDCRVLRQLPEYSLPSL